MKFRKILSGILALCLLSAMAPAAMMEELPPEEITVQLGDDENAPEGEPENISAYAAAQIISETEQLETIEDAVEAMNLMISEPDYEEYEIDNSCDIDIESTGVVIKLTTPQEIESIMSSDESKIAVCAEPEGESVRVALFKVGNVKLLIYLKQPDKNGNTLYLVNLNVTDPNYPSTMRLYDENDEEITGETIKVELTDKYYNIYPVINDSDEVTEKQTFKWSTDDASKAVIETEGQGCITLLKTGRVNVTVGLKGSTLKETIALNIVDSYKPTKVKIVADTDNENYDEAQATYVIDADGTPLQLTAIATPEAETPITWTIDRSSIAELDEDATNDKSMYNFLTPKKAGTVKITAKTYNDKKCEFTLNIVEAASPARVILFAEAIDNEPDLEDIEYRSFYALDEDGDPNIPNIDRIDEYKDYLVNSGLTWDLYYYNTDADKVDRNKALVQAVLLDYNDQIIDSPSVLKGISWTSSKSKVATIKTNRDSTAVVTLKGTGTTKITAKTKNGKSASFNLTIVDTHAPKKIYFVNASGATIKELKMKPGKTDYIRPVLVGVKDESFQKCTFKVHHPSIAKVDKYTGEVYAIRKGKTKVDVEAYNGKTVVFTINIKK